MKSKDVDELAKDYAKNSVSKVFSPNSLKDAYYDVSYNARIDGFKAGYKAQPTPTPGDWISVDKELPDFDVKVLVCGLVRQSSPQMGGNKPVVTITERNDYAGTAIYKDRNRYQDKNQFRFMEETTHWRPLPKPPNK